MERWFLVMKEIMAIAKELKSSRLEDRALYLSELFYKKLNQRLKVKSKSIVDVIAEMDDDSGEENEEEKI